MTGKKDYLAILSFGTGGSYGRASTQAEAVKICKRHAEQDWSSLFHLDGVEAKINVFDITGHNEVFWDHRGVHSESDPDASFDLVDVVTVTLSVPKQRKRKA